MYLVDANVLIEAKNRYYAFDIAPGFWSWLDHAHANSLACSIDAVKQELLAGADELTDWAKAHPGFFRPLDQLTTAQFRDLSTWANSGQPNAKKRVLIPDACLAMGVEFADTFTMLRRTRARLELVAP